MITYFGTILGRSMMDTCLIGFDITRVVFTNDRKLEEFLNVRSLLTIDKSLLTAYCQYFISIQNR